MPYTPKQETEKLKAAMYTYRVLVYFSLACLLMMSMVTGLWSVVAQLFIVSGLVWHFFIRKKYLKEPLEYQTRPQLIALLMTVGLLTQGFLLYRLLDFSFDSYPRFASTQWERVDFSNLVRKITNGDIGRLTVSGMEVVGQYQNGNYFFSIIPERRDYETFYTLLLDKGVNLRIQEIAERARPFPIPISNLSGEYLQFVAVWHVVALIIFIVMLVLFKQFRTIHHALDVDTQTKAATEVDPLGIADELRRLKESR